MSARSIPTVTIRTFAATLGALLLAACGGSSAPAPGTDAPPPVARSAWTTLGTRATPARPNEVAPARVQGWMDYDPPPVYAGMGEPEHVVLAMDDGTGISVHVTRPLGDDGARIDAALPAIVTFTPYNKAVGDLTFLFGSPSEYFARRGYHQVFIDVRGTGRSGGGWDPFSAREQADYPQVLDWIVAQPWSNGVIGMHGMSATATTAMLAAHHPSVRALFPIVPLGDVYRDVVFVGGQASVAFLPAWMSVVTVLGVVNPTAYEMPEQYAGAVLEHLLGAGDFIVPRTVGVLSGAEDSAYDNDYWATKSPLEFARDLDVPTFVVGGNFDIFQRSEPLQYESLKGHTTAKLLMGPWHHLQAAQGEGLPIEGVPPLEHIALQWFDRWLRGIDNGAEDLPNVTQWVWGLEHFETSSDWPHPAARAQRLYLGGGSSVLLGGGSLSPAAPAAASPPDMLLQQPFNGVCSFSSLQISLGLVGYAPLPCWYQDNLAQALELTYDTPPLEQDLYINGPVQADIWMSTTAANAGVVVRLSDLDPGGTAHSLAAGVQTASLRAVDPAKSRMLDGQMIQPWHPFLPGSEQPLPAGEPVLVPVEVFATSALIRRGHRLRISVGASNFPYALMPVPGVIDSVAGLMRVHVDPQHASSIVLPVVPSSELDGR